MEIPQNIQKCQEWFSIKPIVAVSPIQLKFRDLLAGDVFVCEQLKCKLLVKIDSLRAVELFSNSRNFYGSPQARKIQHFFGTTIVYLVENEENWKEN